jgi:hypothetical protein
MRKIFLTSIIIFLIVVSPAWATTYFVSQSGTEPKTTATDIDHPMSVSTHNASTFAADDVIYLCDTITSQVTPPSSGTSGHVITYRGDYAGHACTLDGQASTTYGMRITGKNYITVDSLTVTNQTGTGIRCDGSPTGSSHITIQNCIVYCQLAYGIRVYNNSYFTLQSTLIDSTTSSTENQDDLLFIDEGNGGHVIGGAAGKGNTFLQRKSGGYYIDCIQTSAVNGDMEYSYNYFHDEGCATDAPSIQVQPEETVGTVKIYNNIIFRASTSTLGGPIVFKGSSLVVYFEHNTVVDLNGTGLATGVSNHPTVYAQNNIIYGGGSGRNCYQDSTGTPPAGYPDYNLYYHTSGENTAIGKVGVTDYTWTQWAAYRESHGAYGDPLFTDAPPGNGSGRDFSLQSGSPARGLGNHSTNIGVTDDYLGNPRVNFDAGAYEYIESGGDTRSFQGGSQSGGSRR